MRFSVQLKKINNRYIAEIREDADEVGEVLLSESRYISELMMHVIHETLKQVEKYINEKCRV